MTWEELEKKIQKMAPEQKQEPVGVWLTAEEIHYGSSLITVRKTPSEAEYDKNPDEELYAVVDPDTYYIRVNND